MSTRIRITAGEVTLHGRLNDTPTARMLIETLPVMAECARWGGEVYFPVPVSAAREPDACEVLAAGQIAYWPDGKCVCLFFGPTPMSDGDEIRAASPVNIVGNIEGDPNELELVPHGAEVTIEQA